jgi:hypothetical protein
LEPQTGQVTSPLKITDTTRREAII